MVLLITDSPRGDAIYRLAYLLLVSWWLLPVLAFVALVAALVWMVIDVFGQLIFGSETWSPGGGMGMQFKDILERLAYWPVDQAEWMVFGSRDFPWLP